MHFHSCGLEDFCVLLIKGWFPESSILPYREVELKVGDFSEKKIPLPGNYPCATLNIKFIAWESKLPYSKVTVESKQLLPQKV